MAGKAAPWVLVQLSDRKGLRDTACVGFGKAACGGRPRSVQLSAVSLVLLLQLHLDFGESIPQLLVAMSLPLLVGYGSFLLRLLQFGSCFLLLPTGSHRNSWGASLER